ncbi:MAG: cellulase family glycosylhydrolase [Ferruginibacter sp.]|nr:cellulase family glycosylhydrolase [Ferruginibacter sp.]
MTTWNKPHLIPQELPFLGKWSARKINDWYNNLNWPIGCNYIPQNAINQLEMWQEESFSPFVIEKELSWAAALGFNTMRVFLHHLLWEQDSKGFLKRMEDFLTIADKHGIKTMFVLFDGVWDPFPKLGTQPEPRTHVHNSGWVQSPGFDVLNDPGKYDDLQAYVQGVVSHFKNDERVLIWDIFNEPDNLNTGSYKDDTYVIHKAQLSLKLLEKSIQWVRAIDPVQPITMAPWQSEWSDHEQLSEIDQFMFTHADIISFHCYEAREGMEKRIIELKRYERPLLCTEYMARPFNSTFQEILPIFRKHNVGGYNWGFVAGKSQTHCAWESWEKERTPTEPANWFHDILHPDGQPYCAEEAAYLTSFNKKYSLKRENKKRA